MGKLLQKRITKIILALLVFCLIYILNYHFSFFTIPRNGNDIKNDLFNIITICSVFAGFSFTVLGLLISLSTTRTLEILKETTIMLKHCNIVADSIIMFVISMISSMSVIFGGYSTLAINVCKKIAMPNLHIGIIDFLYMASTGYLLYGIILFIISVRNMMILMKKIFEEDIMKGKKKADNFMRSAQKQVQNLQRFELDDYERDTFQSE